MANKRYDQFNVGSYDSDKIFLIADPQNGSLVKIALNQIPTIFSQDGALASNRTINLNGNFLHITDASDNVVARFADTNVELITRWNPIPDSYASVEITASDENSRLKIEARFSSGNEIKIDLNTQGEQITHTAAQHEFHIPEESGQVSVSNGSEALFIVNTTHGRLEANDGTSQSSLYLDAETGVAVAFDLTSSNGSTVVKIEGDPDDGNIIYTSVNHIMNTSSGQQLLLSPDIGYFSAVNSTGDGNSGFVTSTTGAGFGQVTIGAYFNDGSEEAQIQLLANAFGNSINYTASDQTVNFTGLYQIVGAAGNVFYLNVDTPESELIVTDGVAFSRARLVADAGNNVQYTIEAGGGGNEVSIVLEPEDNTIRHSAGIHVFSGGISTNNGTDEWEFGAAGAGTGTIQTHTLIVTINGDSYEIVAAAV